MIAAETFRENLRLALELAASPEEQRAYARRVPIAQVVAEVFETWTDIYHPDVPTFTVAFDEAERAALARYATFHELSLSSIGLSLDEFQASAVSEVLAHAAATTLAALRHDGGGTR